jgi:hypothetical protein
LEGNGLQVVAHVWHSLAETKGCHSDGNGTGSFRGQCLEILWTRPASYKEANRQCICDPSPPIED